MNAIYYISKGQKTVGPCTLDDLHSYIAYGSLKDSDLVRREGTAAWAPLRTLEELEFDAPDSSSARGITSRRRTARYRDYARVPASHRAGVVMKRLFWGFLLLPPLLWRGAISVFQDRIYTPKKDEKGYLIHWPQGVEWAVSALLMINTLIWATLIWWGWSEAFPVAREIAALISTGIGDLQDWLSR